MSRFTSDYLPLTSDNQLKYTGEIAPNSRIKMEVPPEYQGNPDADEHLNKVRETIVSRYHGKAERALRVFRQDMAVGSTGATERKAKIDEHVFVEYVNQFGREQYTLNISEGLVREVSEELNPLCLLVLHSGGRITAIPMSSVYNGSFKPVYQAEVQADWNAEPIVNAQEQMSASTSVATARGLQFINNIGMYPFGVSSDNGGGNESSIMNGTGSTTSATVYTQTDDYTFDLASKQGHHTGAASISGATAVSSSGERKKKQEDDQRDAQGYGVKTTTYRVMDTSLGGGTRSADPPEIIDKIKIYRKKKDNEYTRQILTGWDLGPSRGCLGNGPATPTYEPSPEYTDDITEKWDGELRYHKFEAPNGEAPQEKQWVRKRVETHGPVSLDLLVFFSDPTSYIFGFLVSSGGVGTHYSIVTSEEEPEGSTTYYEVQFNWGIGPVPNASNVMSSTFDGIYLYGPTQWWVDLYNENFCGAHHISTEISYEGPYTSTPFRLYKTRIQPNETVIPAYFPYAVDGAPFLNVRKWDDDGNLISMRIDTPYDTLAEASHEIYFTGWLNLHNGKILVQGGHVVIDGQKIYGLYFDGEKKTDVGGISVSEIATMYLDVPLDWIKKWPKA